MSKRTSSAKSSKSKAIAPRVGSRAARIAQTAANKQSFLTAYEAIGTVTGAAVQSRVNRQHVYDWLAEDEAFAKAFEASKERAVDLAEQELRRRGIAGYDKPVYQGGKRVGVIREFSDACLIFYLKGRRRDVFGDRRELSGPQGGPIPIDPTSPTTVIITYGADDSDSRTPPS